MRLAQPRGDQVHPDQDSIRMRRAQILEQEARGAAEIGDRRPGRERADPVDDRMPGPAVQEVGAGRLGVDRLELLGPVDRRARVDVGDERRPPPGRPRLDSLARRHANRVDN